MADHEPDLRSALTKLFTAFPLHSQTAATRTERKHQYALYHDRLRELPVDLVERAVLELIDTASFMPRIGTIRGRVQARIKNLASLASPSGPSRPLLASGA